MIPGESYIQVVRDAIPKFSEHPPNPNQTACVRHDPAQALMIVAGPGSGKTTVLVLRALRFIFVDGMLPEQIILTTFTRKAAEEMRSRLIEWGSQLIDYLKVNPPSGVRPDFQKQLDSIDINRFVTGTLDSICEDILTRLRHPGDAAPVVVEGFVANALLRWDGLYQAGSHPNSDVDAYVSTFTFNRSPPANLAQKLGVLRTLVDRLVHDKVDISSYRNGVRNNTARNCVADTAEAYWDALSINNHLDFARLEQIFLERLSSGRVERFTEGVRAILVDEYQDTNPLQESIYFELISQTGASLTIVGDDDQALYRFRGATIELFRDYVSRFRTALPGMPPPTIEYLVENYRSTPEIIDFCNDFVDADPAYTQARVQPPKPLIQAQLGSRGLPILGMFRPDRDTLADDLTEFLMDIFRGGGRRIDCENGAVTIAAASNGGDFGDAVFLSHTVNEHARAFGDQEPRERLPIMLRNRMATHGIGVFNPRGRALRDIEVIQQLLGTILLCIDPAGSNADDGRHFAELIGQNALRYEAIRYLRKWREIAQSFVDSNPNPNNPHTIANFVEAWQTHSPQGVMPSWPTEWPLLELCFKLITWIPYLRDDPEGQVYLEAISRVIAQAGTFSSYRGMLVFGNPEYTKRSVGRAILDILAPIAENEVEVDEDIMPSIPRDRLSFMTIHQAKGLEFPLVIVDVSSDYKSNHQMQRFRRFPENPSSVTLLEDDLVNHCDIGALRATRSAIDRTFDDLVRLYYVAYSRPQSVLMLVGLDRCLRYKTTIKHVATGWRRNERLGLDYSNYREAATFGKQYPFAINLNSKYGPSTTPGKRNNPAIQSDG